MNPRFRFCALALICLPWLSACITQPRIEGPPPAPFDATVEGFTADIRIVGFDEQAADRTADALSRLRTASDGSMDFLALSGGGAAGSFGAGVLVGMSLQGERPQFEVVTGVSTGALIAPFAFLGEDWDDELTEAFASESASNLLESRGLGIFFLPSFFKPAPLRELVDQYVTDDLIAAIADETEKGRVLLVATTNLDRQLTTYWDLGKIARQRNDEARELFRDVLIASASVPGVFPPVMFEVEADGREYQEMHVDGAATVPFFLGPELMALWSNPGDMLEQSNLYIIVNGQLQTPSSSTPINTIQIVSKSFDTMLMFSARLALGEYAAVALQNGMNLNVAYIPPDLAFGGSLNFEQDERKRLFNFARSCARQNHIWFTQNTLIDSFVNARIRSEDLKEGFGVPKFCPTQLFEKQEDGKQDSVFKESLDQRLGPEEADEEQNVDTVPNAEPDMQTEPVQTETEAISGER